MPVSLPSIDRADFDAFKSGDEMALERVYRKLAPAMSASALDEVGHAGGAARAMEQVMVRAWSHRTEFATPEQLHDLVTEELHESAMREKGRRQALRRFEEHEGGGTQGSHTPATTIDVNETWSHILKALHPDVAAKAAAQQAAADASRHGAASHIAGVGKSMSKTTMAGIAIGLVVVLGGGLYLLQKASESTRVTSALRSKEAIQTSTKAGQRGSMKLADASNVDLGADATLTIPKGFPEKMRAVMIDGAARFTVTAGRKELLEVHAGNAVILADGATFTLMTNKGEPVTIKVDSGTATVASESAKKVLTAGQAARVMPDGSLVDPTADQVAEATAWASGRLVVSNRTIKDLLPILKRWYNVEVRAEPALLTRRVTMNAALGRTDSVITALEIAGNVKQIYLKQQMVLTDAPPKKGK